MNIAYAILGAIALAIGTFCYGDHVGGMASKAALEGFQAAQAENTAKAVLAERAAGAAELARVNTILKEYQDAPIDPIVPGIATRLLVAACPAGGPVPSAGADPGAAVAAGAVPAGDSELARLSQAAFDAGAHDAAELSAIQQAWPR